MSRVRIPVTLVAVCLTGAAGLACGGDAGGEGSTGSSAEALARVRASDYARAVNLHASDVPYFEPIPDSEEEDPTEARKHDRELMKCVGVEEDPEPLAEVKSPEFGTDSPGELLRVASAVEVGADAKRAAKELKLIRSRRAEHCLQRVYASAIEEEESSTAEVRDVSVSRVRFPAPDIEDGFAYRFTASVTVHPSTSELTAYRPAAEPNASVTVRIYVDIIGFVVGPTSVSLTATGVPTPVSRTLEHNLLRVLHERAAERTP
jgi:hypothetical protein